MWPDHSPALEERTVTADEVDTGQLLSDAVLAIIGRAHWQSAKSVEEVAPHAYVVKGWDKDSVTPEEFELIVLVIKTFGRHEEWDAPAGFYDSGKRPRYKNRYLYLITDDGHFAYWFTWPRGCPPMLNREHTSIQEEAPTRRALNQQLGLDIGEAAAA